MCVCVYVRIKRKKQTADEKKGRKRKHYLAIVAVVYASSLRWSTGGFTDSPFTLTSCELRKGFTGNA